MWIADGWEDYELLDCGGGEKLERWGKQILVRPDPQAIWETPRTNRGWRNAQGRYYRSSSGGGHWDKEKLPESWTVNYKDLKFQVKPMNFKHTGLFPEQAVNWDFAREKIKNAGRPLGVRPCAAGKLENTLSGPYLYRPPHRLQAYRPFPGTGGELGLDAGHRGKERQAF